MGIMNLSEKEIIERIGKGNITVAVVGLGRIDLPTAYMFANAGMKVSAIDDILQILNTNR